MFQIVLIERAHSRGVVHRDIKAANMLVAKDGSLVLGDMGLARVLPEGQHVDSFCSRTRIGTPDHMAPEVIGGLRYGAGCDRWSAAVDFYVALTGKVQALNLGFLPDIDLQPSAAPFRRCL